MSDQNTINFSSQRPILVPAGILTLLSDVRGADLKVLVAIAGSSEPIRQVSALVPRTGLTIRSCFASVKLLESKRLIVREDTRWRCCVSSDIPSRLLPAVHGPITAEEAVLGLIRQVTGRVPTADFLTDLQVRTDRKWEELARCLTDLRDHGARFVAGDQLLIAFVYDWFKAQPRRPGPGPA